MNDTKWTCPKCGHSNEDNQEETMLPLCDGCGEQVFWDEITTEKSQEKLVFDE